MQGYPRPDRMADIRAVLSSNIKHLRAAKDISQERLALESGVDRTMLSKIERKVTNPSLQTLLKLADCLEVQLFELLQPRWARAGPWVQPISSPVSSAISSPGMPLLPAPHQPLGASPRVHDQAPEKEGPD